MRTFIDSYQTHKQNDPCYDNTNHSYKTRCVLTNGSPCSYHLHWADYLARVSTWQVEQVHLIPSTILVPHLCQLRQARWWTCSQDSSPRCMPQSPPCPGAEPDHCPC
ncbi:unnamed protein product [Meganyctiphanes norvegica]|uniref:Uncharacterized protein n=1 Tax=Meganyctiphanes norvegica TaxID=48144 RepID=A0AAV2RXM3_MEGNR